jgi:hypothetical protein
MNRLELFANLASVLTAVVAALATVYFWNDKRSKRHRLENYLRRRKQDPLASTYQHTILHLMAKLGMTEEEILHASFSSCHIVCKIRADHSSGLATELVFEYSEEPKPSVA